MNASFAVDVRILWKTLFAVLNRQGIASRDHATMAKFIGTLTESDAQELPPQS